MEALVREPPSWLDEFPQDSEENEPRTTQVGSDGKMNHPLGKIVTYWVFHVEKAGKTERKQSNKGDFGDQNAYQNSPQNS